MPKGGVLHSHDIALTSVDWVISDITYRDNLWMCVEGEDLSFKWAFIPDFTLCDYIPVEEARRQSPSPQQFDDYLRSKLTINVPNPAENTKTRPVMKVSTDSGRARRSRSMVFEMLMADQPERD